MNENTKLARIEEQVKALPSASQEAMAEIIKGMYAGKPLLGVWGFTDQPCQRLNADSTPGRDVCTPAR